MAGLPSLYGPWLAAALVDPVEGEPRSDCAACPQSASGAFHPDVKCCGTWPSLPNYLVGGALLAGGLGADTLRERIEARATASPLGLGCPPERAAARAEVDRSTGFGTDPGLACPHLREGRCSIWAHRDAVCATWFCRLERGAVGQAFWLALRAWLQCLERQLARHALDVLGVSTTRWGPWAHDREGLYVETWRVVSAMPWDEVRQVGGFELRTRLRDLRAAQRERTVPRPVVGPFDVGPYEVLPDGVRAWSKWDRLAVDPAVLTLLDRPEALSQDVLRALVDHRVLVER